jgi:hypothetical protein
MTRDEAKDILQAYRPNGGDAGDAFFTEALEMTRTDAELGRWFSRLQAFDRAIALQLAAVEPPAGLKAAILAGATADTGSRESSLHWRNWLAMAAGIAVVFGAGILFWPKPVVTDPAFLAFISNDARHSELHGGKGEPTSELQAKLSQPTTRLSAGLPVNFDSLQTAGCRSIAFHGHAVLEICFNRDGQWFHCYIARQADFPALAALSRPVFSEENKTQVATWSDSAHVFLVAGEAGTDALRRLL